MIKKRFITEYANYKIDEIASRETFTESEKIALQHKITRAVFNCEYGVITINECMRILSEI